ncbi:methyl-accepting chemotaxis protein [Pseudomonas sp. DTU_2021_1001937_2_SI_NGA_ILE_001]|nr:methyl-accepting chemotaxis protein [Pseudomonas sp. DTU_2021_1001937_2_SI_NGA_ILE_001]WNW12231.1 methyl-accepting chemotaxis protein [Pseudomonas sp. DTU_2021_1001937_2_SI_NGA_ILE_001]
MSLRKMNIAPRAFLGFALIGALMLILGVFALLQMSKIRGATEALAQDSVPAIRELNRINEITLRMRVLSYRLLVNRDPASQQKNQELLVMRNQQLDQARKAYEPLLDKPQERAMFKEYLDLLAGYRQLEERMRSLSANGDLESVSRLLNSEMTDNADRINAVLGRLVESHTQELGATTADAEQQYQHAFDLVVGLLVIATLLTLLFAWRLTRSITEPIASALSAAETIAAGKLNQSIEVHGQDEAGRLLQAMHTMQHNLRDTLLQISGSAGQLASAAEELNAVTDESARGLSRQNDEIEQAATAVNQMSSAVEAVAQNADTTSQASQAATRSARDGRDLVQETLTAIERMSGEVQDSARQVSQLAEQSRDIGKVLDVIRGLADQTNLLALNAAIEAARAGEAGRGFAVVADEVRALAHRTQESTSEIERMVANIQGGTEQAVGSMHNSTQHADTTLNVAKGAGQALDAIHAAVEEINSRNRMIADAAQEQVKASREVDLNLVNIRDLSTQTATGAQQTSAASGELSRLAVGLNTLVARFSL